MLTNVKTAEREMAKKLIRIMRAKFGIKLTEKEVNYLARFMINPQGTATSLNFWRSAATHFLEKKRRALVADMNGEKRLAKEYIQSKEQYMTYGKKFGAGKDQYGNVITGEGKGMNSIGKNLYKEKTGLIENYYRPQIEKIKSLEKFIKKTRNPITYVLTGGSKIQVFQRKVETYIRGALFSKGSEQVIVNKKGAKSATRKGRNIVNRAAKVFRKMPK